LTGVDVSPRGDLVEGPPRPAPRARTARADLARPWRSRAGPAHGRGRRRGPRPPPPREPPPRALAPAGTPTAPARLARVRRPPRARARRWPPRRGAYLSGAGSPSDRTPWP